RQVIVDFGVGQVALFLALDDQGLDLGLLLLIVFRGHVYSGGSCTGEKRNYRSLFKGERERSYEVSASLPARRKADRTRHRRLPTRGLRPLPMRVSALRASTRPARR